MCVSCGGYLQGACGFGASRTRRHGLQSAQRFSEWPGMECNFRRSGSAWKNGVDLHLGSGY